MSDCDTIDFDYLLHNPGEIIAEIACGHEGDINKLKLLIDAISFSGAKIVKFQIFSVDERTTPSHSQRDLFQKLSLTKDEWIEANNYAREKKLSVFADVYGIWSYELAKHLDVDGYKIHSEDLLNTDFIRKVATDNKILLIGIGGAHRSEIFNIITWLDKANLCKKIILMPGIQTFPTPVNAHSLTEIEDLIQKYSSFGIKVGFADHISGDHNGSLFLPLMAISKGAIVIEKHITVNRSDKWEDYESALGKDDFKKFVNFVENSSEVNQPITTVNDYEKQYRKMFKKVPVAKTDLVVGREIKFDDILFKKFNDTKIPLPSNYLVGKKLKVQIPSGEVISYDKLETKVGAVIVARRQSQRFPDKAIKEIVGKEAITLLIERVKRCKNLDCVILATTLDPVDDVLEEIAEKQNILVYRGSRDNVALRFYNAAKKYGLEQIVRITGDDLLQDDIMIDKAIDSHLKNCCDVTLIKNMPYGCEVSIFSINTIEKIVKNVIVEKNSEYLEHFLENDRHFSTNYIKSDYSFNKNIRLTLDYKLDLDVFRKIFENFYFTNPSFTLRDVLKWLDGNPTIIDINKSQKIKFKKSELDLRIKI